MEKHSIKASGSGTTKKTIGLDLGDQYSYFCMLDEAGEEVEWGRVKTSGEALEKRFGGEERARVVVEAGTHSPWVSRLLRGLGHEVIVANPRKVRLISDNDGKDDGVDAALLARLGRVDVRLLCPIEHRGAEAQADLAVIRAREALVRGRTQLVNHVRGVVKSMGFRLERCSVRGFARQVAEQVPEALRAALDPVLEVIAELSQRINGYDQQIRQCCQQKYPETELLQAVPGVGPLTARGYVLTLENPHRFPHSRAVGSFLGLRPGRDKSGQQDPELRITKAGSPWLRRLLVGSAHYILGPFGPDSDLRRWGLKLAGRGRKNAKKRAVVAVARKLAVLLHRLWVNGEVYQPLYHAEPLVILTNTR